MERKVEKPAQGEMEEENRKKGKGDRIAYFIRGVGRWGKSQFYLSRKGERPQCLHFRR